MTVRIFDDTFFIDSQNKIYFPVYYYGGQSAHNVKAVLEHKPDLNHHDQIHVKIDDEIGIAGNHWDGFSKGKNLRTNVSKQSY